MLRLKHTLRAAVVLAVAACTGDSVSPLGPSGDPAREISDAARSSQVQGFYFLPPMVPDPGPFTGTFDPTQSPVAEICVLNAARDACTATVVKQFNGGSGSEAITVDPGSQSYSANWTSANLALSTGKKPTFYRLVVSVGGVVFGYADLWVVGKSKDLKNLGPDYVGVVRNSPLQIKFRIETGAGPTQRAPAAQGDAYPAADGNPVTVAAPGVLANDDLGVPAAALASFGGGSLGGAVTDHAAGDTITFGSGGSLTVNAGGGFTFTPAAGFTGTFTFQYRITNGSGSSDATVTLTGPAAQAPVAVDDEYATGAGTPLTVPAAGVLANDTLGTPAAALAFFGGGSLGGTVTDNAAGDTVAFGSGGSLTVNAGGGFTFTPATGFTGTFTFQYRITNSAGSSDATVSIAVNTGPTAVDDAPAANSSPGDAYHGLFNSALSLPAPGIVSNDALGNPAAQVVSFGGGDLGGTVESNAAGSTVNFGTSGSLRVNADGSVVFTPDANFTGLFTFHYRVTNSVGSDDGQVTIAVGARPAAAADSYPHTLVGNVPINTATSSQFSVRTNDQGDGVTLALASVSNGTVILETGTGKFSFDPTPGYEGPAGFTYTVTNGFGTDTGTVSLTVSGMIWFINNAAAEGTGTLASPFSSVAAFTAANNGSGNNPAAGDHVFIHESGTGYTGPLTLLDGQKVIGQDAASSLSALSGLTPPADSPALPATNSGNATVVNLVSAANGIDLAQNNALHGLRVGNTTGTGISGASVGTLVVSGVTVNTTGQALSLANGTVNATFNGVSSSGGASNVSLSGLGGTLDLGSGALSGSTGVAFSVNGGNAAVTYAGTITNAAGRAVSVTGRTGGALTLSGNLTETGDGILVQNNTGGTVVFSGASKSIATGTNKGVTLANNGGATVNFNGGGLAITTGTGNGFEATGGGTVNVTGLNNTISSAGGIALNVANTGIGASGLLFRSISASGGSSGIVLNATGSAGGLTVSGDGATAGSGGTIQNTTGAGISLSSTTSPSFTRMVVQNTGRSGIAGTGVVNASITNSTISNSGTSGGANDSNIDFFADVAPGSENNLSGVVTITGNSLSSPLFHNVDVQNWSGTISELNLSSNTLANSSTQGGGIRLIAFGSAGGAASITRATIDNNQITGAMQSPGLQVQCGNANAAGPLATCGTPGSGTNVVNITNNRVQGASAAARIGTEGLLAILNGRGQANYNVSSNDVRHTTGRAMGVSSFGQGTMTSTVSNNTIVANNTFAAAGLEIGADSTANMASNGTYTATVTGNNVSQSDGVGIWAIARGSSHTLRVKLQNNTIAAPLSGVRPGLRIDSGSSAGNTTVCANVSGNTSAGSGGTQGIGIRKQGTNATLNTFGIHGMAATSSPGVESYVAGLNPAGGGVLLISATSGFSNCSLP
jgi:hypothetical protein